MVVDYLNREDAYYYKILLMSGLSDGYDEWLDGYLNNEDPLSEIVLNLSLCGSDVNKTISCLHNYCANQALDEKLVCEKLRLFLKAAYHSGRFSKKEIISYMYCFANSHGDPGDFETAIWDSMYYMDYYHSLVEDGIILPEHFDSAFLSFLNNGTPLDANKLWNLPDKREKTILERLFKLFKRR